MPELANPTTPVTGFEILPLDHISTNDRGSTFHLPLDRMGMFILGQRNQGSINGRHYHKGLSASKAPEYFVLLRGTVTLNMVQLSTMERYSLTISQPSTIIFHPNLWHEVIADTDITFIELNSLEEHIADTFTDVQVD